MEKTNRKWPTIIVVLSVLLLVGFLFSGFISLFFGSEIEPSGNVALIPIQGVITAAESESLLGESVASSNSITSYIEKADKNPNIKAIILEINSGGGSPVASEEIVNAIKKTNKTTVALIREMGASGAYWVASASDHIVASRASIVGSVGVIASYLQFSGLLEHYNVTYERLVAGKYKDIGSPYKELSVVERSLLQEQLDLLHDYFLDDVVQSRHLTEDQKAEIGTANIFMGIQAKALGLIDEFGGKDEVLSYVKGIIGEEPVLAEYKERKSWLSMLGRVMNEKSFFVGRGIGSTLLDPKQSNNINILT